MFLINNATASIFIGKETLATLITNLQIYHGLNVIEFYSQITKRTKCMWLISGGFPPSKRGPGVSMLKFHYFHHLALKVSACLLQASGKGKSMGIMHGCLFFYEAGLDMLHCKSPLIITTVYLQGHI